MADGMGLLLGAVSAIVTARWLGPGDKGTLAALVFVSSLLVQGCSLGLGDSAMVWIGRRRATVQEAVSATLGAVLLSTVVGSLIVVAYAWLQLPLDQPYVRLAILASCVVLPLAVTAGVLSCVLNSQNRIPLTSAIWLISSGTTALITVFFVGVVPLSILGGTLGGVVGSIAGLLIGAVAVRRLGVRLRPRLDLAYLLPALRFGLRVQLSYLLTFAAARVDLLLVYSISGRSEAGTYSVALTLGTVAGSAAAALSYASFPRLAQLGADDARELTTRVVRTGLAVAVASGALLAILLPVAIPVILGESYQSSIAPALVLIVGGVFWSGQWLLSRAAAAQGDPSLLFRSFLLNFVTMIALDVILIPHLQGLGAAIASVVGPAAGLGVCLARHSKTASIVELVPRPSDLRPVISLIGAAFAALLIKCGLRSSAAAN